jgi:hypothetical protein
MTTKPSSNRPTHRVYAVIIKKEGGAKGAWLEIGAAWPHRDGQGLRLYLVIDHNRFFGFNRPEASPSAQKQQKIYRSSRLLT